MTGIERLERCIRLEPVDRPAILPSYMDRLAGIQAGLDYADILERPDDVTAVMLQLWDRLGGFGDAMYYPGGSDIYNSCTKSLMRWLIPGKDIPRDVYWQIIEKPNMERDDYDLVINHGWKALFYKVIPKIWDYSENDLKKYGSLEAFDQAQGEKGLAQFKKDCEIWEKKGIDVFMGGVVYTPQMAFSCCRSLTEYTVDLYEIPDKVEEATWAALPGLIQGGVRACKATGIPRIAIILERGSAQYYPLRIFERFEFPQLKKMIEEFLANGITPLLHIDTDWSKNLPYFKEFPKGKVFITLDGTTDIFNAKKVFRDHTCLMGDVPASLLVAGTPQEVEKYVRRLVEEVGDGGGFILGTGCSMPPNATFENVKIMIDTCKSYGI